MYRHALTRLLTVLVLATVASALAVAPQLTRATPVSAATTTSISVCGPVTAYLPATNLTSGQIVIAGTAYPIVAGAVITGGSITYGASACLTATADSLGEILAGTLVPNVSTNVSVCGTLAAFTPATSVTAGSLTIGGQTLTIAPNNSLGFVGTVFIGTPYCLSGTLNLSGQLVGGTLTPSSVANISVCGVVSSYIASTSATYGTITIGGQTFGIVPGAVLTGGAFVVGSSVCLTGTVNGASQITSGTFSGLVPTPVPTTGNICGPLTSYIAATSASFGTITINGQTFQIVPGTVVSGGVTLLTGGTYCLSGTLNGFGQLTAVTISPIQLGPLSLCGPVTALVPAGATAAGSITISGQTYAIAPGVTIVGAPNLAVNAAPILCLQATLSLTGQISSGTLSAASSGAPTVNICGAVTAYTAATATAGGTITVGGNTFAIVAGTQFVGVAQPAVGTSVCLTLVVNTAGAIVGATVVTSSTGVPLSATLVGASEGPRALARPE
jgi:hypothetical protein